MKTKIVIFLFAILIFIGRDVLAEEKTNLSNDLATDRIGLTCADIDKAITGDDINIDLLPKAKVQKMNLKAESILKDLQKKLLDNKLRAIWINEVVAGNASFRETLYLNSSLAEKLVKFILEAKYKNAFIYNPHLGYTDFLSDRLDIKLYFDGEKDEYYLTVKDMMEIYYSETGGCYSDFKNKEGRTGYIFFYSSESYAEMLKELENYIINKAKSWRTN